MLCSFITGDSHTLNGVPLTDICDTLAGRYPKDFKFVGWHPHCRCHAVSILKTEDEMEKDTERILAGEKPTQDSVNTVRDVPAAFKNWVEDNADRIESAEKRVTQPYFIRDNKEYIQNILKPAQRESDANTGTSPQEIKKTSSEIAAERHAARTQEDIDRIQSEWNTNRMNHIMALSERIGSYRDADFRELASLLDIENSSKDFKAFKSDYQVAKQYLDNKITEQTALARRFMEDPANIANMRELAKSLGIVQGDYMTFFEANVLRGNPNYAVSTAYRINCQTCVVAHELRRRGFNIEALGNTAGSWLEKLSHKTNEIWLNTDGKIPEKVTIGAEYNYFSGTTPEGRRFKRGWDKTVSNRRQLIKELEESITEDGRYHIDWFWNTQSKTKLSGHIITLEKIGDTIRYYDPQNGKVITDFYDYINDIKLNRGIRLLRVDNLRINTDYAAHILGKSGSQIMIGNAGNRNVGGILKNIKTKEVIHDIQSRWNERKYAIAKQNKEVPDLIIHPNRRVNASLNKREAEKFKKEYRMGTTYAKFGHKVEMLEEIPGVSSPDAICDGLKIDFKSLSSANNIERHAKDAIFKQGADEVWFEFTSKNDKIISTIQDLATKGIHGRYYFSGDKTEYRF